MIKNSLDFQLKKVNGTNVLLTDKEIYNFSQTKAGKKRKRLIHGTYRNHNGKKTAKL